MSNAPGGFVPRKKMLLNDYRQPHPTGAAPLDGAKYPPSLVWEITNGGKIVLKCNDGVWKEGAKTNHKEVEMDYAHRGALFETLLEAASDPLFTIRQWAVQKKQFVKAGGVSRMSDQPVLQANLTVTRQENGIITLGYSKGDYKIVFLFNGTRDSVVYMKSESGERVVDYGLMSRANVRMWVAFHRRLLDRMEADAWEPPKPRDDGGNRNNQSNNRPGNTRGGGDDFGDSNTFDDDVDF